MNRSSSDWEAAQRARWLAELTASVEEARLLVREMGEAGDASGERRDLLRRIDLALAMLESLRRGGWAAKLQEYPSEWIELLPVSARLRSD